MTEKNEFIEPARNDDAADIAAIYNYYIINTPVTFEEDIVSTCEMEQRVKDVKSSGLPWYVLRDGEAVIGYAYASRWKSRCAYRFSVESTVYLSKDHVGQGKGRGLYVTLIDDLRKKNYHSVIGGIALPNKGSCGLHEALGFRKIAHFAEVGRKFETWIDVGYWQLIL